jgi:hypothetical protein
VPGLRPDGMPGVRVWGVLHMSDLVRSQPPPEEPKDKPAVWEYVFASLVLVAIGTPLMAAEVALMTTVVILVWKWLS